VTLDTAGMLAVRARVARLQEGMHVVAHDDPAVLRHARELFGIQGEPNPSEAPHRLLLEWVGQASPRDSALVMALKARGLLLRHELAALDRLAQRTIRRVDGVTSRSLGTRDGLAETYRWGPAPGTYVASVAFADADRILALFETGAEFRIVGKHAGETGSAARPDADWRRLIDAWRANRGHAALPPEGLAIRYHQEQGLTKMLPAGNAGYWTPFLPANRR
jgi:hypothetical protein